MEGGWEKENEGSSTYPFVPRPDSFAAVPVECPARSAMLNEKIIEKFKLNKHNNYMSFKLSELNALNVY